MAITKIDYALMAGASYVSTRFDINKFPIPNGWISTNYKNPPNGSGFEAISFVPDGTTLTTSTEIVISYAGTYDIPSNPFTNPDMIADALLGFGLDSTQLLQAADYYLQVKASAPAGAHITLTGHSLGGGLAALIGVFFGETAVTFDQAPFAQAALFQAQALLDYLSTETTISGAPLYTAAQLSGLTNFIAQQQANGGIPNSGLVTNINVEGEFLSGVPWNIADRIGTTVENIDNTALGVAGTSLHSIALLTAFLQSDQSAADGKALNDVTHKLPDLLAMLFDDRLFESRTDTGVENFLERLIKHESGVEGSIVADAMVTRFTEDLWKLAKDGGLTLRDGNTGNLDLNEVSKTLIAFAMQFYYEDTANAINKDKELFNTISGGVQFDLADVSKNIRAAFEAGQAANLNDAKGYQLYFSKYLEQARAGLTADEAQMIQSLLPYMRDWYVQAGAGGLSATDTLNRGAFMLGGSGDDLMVGGNGNDLLVGNIGNDYLDGGDGDDVMIGGEGMDTYVVKGHDTIVDSGRNNILYNGELIAGVFLSDGSGSNFAADDGRTLSFHSPGRLVLSADDSITFQNQTSADAFAGNDFGIFLDNRQATITSTNLAGTTGQDFLIGSQGNDLIQGYTDIDYISGTGGDDVIDGGDGNDVIAGGSESDNDTLYGNDGDDLILGDGAVGVATVSGDSTHLTQNNLLTGIQATLDANGFMSYTYAQPDTVSVGTAYGPGGDDTIYAGAGNDVVHAGGGKDYVEGGDGADIISGDDGDDIILGQGGNDILLGDVIDDYFNYGDDILSGGDGNDKLWGAGGNDYLLGGAGDDYLHGDGNLNISLDGNDVLDGGAGNDRLVGGGGDDLMLGGEGNDGLLGQDGNDMLYGGAGEDYLDGGAGNDFLDGGEGADTLLGSDGNDTLLGGAATIWPVERVTIPT